MRSTAINLRAATAVASLLESDGLKFHNELKRPSRNNDELDLNFSSTDMFGPRAYAEAAGTMVIDWELQIDAREWGIKSIDPIVLKFVLDIEFEQSGEEGYMHPEPDYSIHYEYPEAAPDRTPIGADLDAPTPANIDRMSTPKWKVDYKVDPHKGDRELGTYWPRAEVDIDRRTIEILF